MSLNINAIRRIFKKPFDNSYQYSLEAASRRLPKAIQRFGCFLIVPVCGGTYGLIQAITTHNQEHVPYLLAGGTAMILYGGINAVKNALKKK